MAFKNELIFYCQLFTYFASFIVTTNSQFVEVGSCSPTCHDILAESTNANSLQPKYCSCSSSCYIYRDCCHNAPNRKAGRSANVNMMCISISDMEDYKAVAQCSTDWTGSSNSCKDNIGRLPPVTSTSTGTTYANRICAECNNDAQQLVIWNVTLRCCEEHDNLANQAERNFTYSRGTLYSIGSDRNCACKYSIHEQDTSLSGLELRSCQSRDEKSRCSYTWTDNSIRDKCYSFIEPVYSRDKVYRNVYCAECNYERPDMVYCKPEIVKRMLEEGSNDTAIFSHCVTEKIRDCLHYFRSRNVGRGKSYGFREVVNIHETVCIPPPNKRCCAGEKYDHSSKKCRKLLD